MASPRMYLIVIGLLSGSIAPRSHGNEIASTCGPKALYALARIEGRAIDYERILARLSVSDHTSCTFQDLQGAARASGFALVGVEFERWARQPDGPALVHLRQGPHGHFVTVRPVGHTGKLIQVIDGDLAPEVVDAKEWAASSEWTGFALVPVRTPWSLSMAWGLVIGATTVLVIGHLSHRRTRGFRSRAHLLTRRTGGAQG